MTHLASITLADGREEITNATSAVHFSLKYLIIRSAFVPSPDAKTAIFFITTSYFMHNVYKIVQRNNIYLQEYLFKTRNIYSFAPKNQ